MKNVQDDLGRQLLQQHFMSESEPEQHQLEQCQGLAKAFVHLENGISVLSDLKQNRSYIYAGSVVGHLNIFQNRNALEIESIWERELFECIEAEDVLRKHLLELQFFEFIKTIPFDCRKNFCVYSKVRLANRSQSLVHKMFYFSSMKATDVELALCLYHFDVQPLNDFEGCILDTTNGRIIPATAINAIVFLSVREKEILKMIQSGKKSKEIAELLFISLFTVNRHRQNILKKMKVSTMTEACMVASRFKWI